jgi:hypothetical protein
MKQPEEMGPEKSVGGAWDVAASDESVDGAHQPLETLTLGGKQQGPRIAQGSIKVPSPKDPGRCLPGQGLGQLRRQLNFQGFFPPLPAEAAASKVSLQEVFDRRIHRHHPLNQGD